MTKRSIISLLTAAVLFVSPVSSLAATLQNGSSGQEVVALQIALNQLGYYNGGFDGKYGTATENAVRKFQGRNGLKIDGKAGSNTQSLIFSKAAALSGTAAPTAAPTASSSSASTSSGSYFGGNYATLSYGSSGTRVTLLQQALKALGYTPGSMDGRFGLSTQTAVTAFQRDQKLTADGKAGKTTLQRIEKLLSSGSSASSSTAAPSQPSSSSSGSALPSRTLRRGYTGDDVKTVQQQLTRLGYYSGKIDGVYGSGTIAAVKAFQKANKLTADGLAGSKTVQLMFNTSAATAAPAATPAAAAPTPAPTAATYTTLRSGDKGDAVKQMQQALLALNYAINVSGTYDAATRTAVSAFQKNNGLISDGVAGQKTLSKLYSGTAAGASSSASSTSSGSSSTTASPGTAASQNTAATAVGSVRLLHWFNDIKPSLSNGQTLQVYEPGSGLSWSVKVISRGNHADCEPLSATDTANMVKAFGGKNTWTQKSVFVRLPSGVWTLGSTHDMPHLTGSITDNDFNGHLCVHFLRDMDECKKNDPNYGVSNQNTIRTAWKALTGEVIN